MTRTFEVEVSDETASALEERGVDDARIVSELQETLETLASEPERRQQELRETMMNLPQEPAPEEELSDEETAEKLREFLSPSHPRSKDPRLD